MIVSCKCLNVQIETKGEPVKFDKRSLGTGHNSSFFLKELLICEPVAVTKRVKCMVREDRDIDGWITYKCLCCDLQCYAESADKNSPTTLIGPDLLTDPKVIEELEKSKDFSQVYQIVMTKTDNSDQIHSPPSLEEKARMLSIINELQRQLKESIKKQTRIAEERLRIVTEIQYSN